MRPLAYIVIAVLLLAPVGAGLVGRAIGPGLRHPMRLNPERLQQTAEMLKRSRAAKEDFNVCAPDGVELRGWKIRPLLPIGDWMLLFYGVSDNRTGVLGHAEFLLRHGCSVVMMDSRAHGESGGDMATYGWKERHDTVAVVDTLYSTEKVSHLYALGVSMGAAVALQSAVVEPRIEGVVFSALIRVPCISVFCSMASCATMTLLHKNAIVRYANGEVFRRGMTRLYIRYGNA
jgi:pimeloyl-ACP methyl ester carboxylesterase